jgi:FAD:protein FMN transferase
MGTFFIFQIVDEIPDAELTRMCDAAMEILHAADNTFSLYKPESEVSKLNNGSLSWDKASSVQLKVRSQCLEWKEKTKGFFNPISPSGGYDPSGLVKTWAARNAAQYLEANGIRSFTLNAGGDIFLSDNLEDAPLNRVGLSNLTSIADEGAGANLILDLAGTAFRAVATSGSAERGEHIWKSPDSAFIQSTVVAKDLVLADIWATALISGGQLALEEFKLCVPAAEAMAFVVGEDLSIQSTAGFASVLATL